jgi:hypothetical protein
VPRFVEIHLTRKFCLEIPPSLLPPYNQTPADALLVQKPPSVWITKIYYSLHNIPDEMGRALTARTGGNMIACEILVAKP